MPQVLLLIAAGAGLLLARRLLRKEQDRISAELREAREATDRRERPVPLQQDPTTGVYRPKQTH
jgi:Tfp pilus assembly protein FimT